MAEPAAPKTPGKQHGKAEDKKRKKPVEYNARWKGYLFIFLCSLINLSAASNVSADDRHYRGMWQMSVTYGCVTFALSFLILLFDRTKFLSEKLGDYTKAYDGKLECGVLTLFVLWWVVGVAFQTQVNGIAYLANNVYFSAWMSLAACVYTLNEWSTEKDILSIEELTSISETLPSWYLLLFGSTVVAGTSVQLWLEVFGDFEAEAALGMGLGLGSFILCMVWILSHYNFIEIWHEGGWLELGSSFAAILVWIVGVAVLTSEGAVAATLVGTGCSNVGSLDVIPGNSLHCNVTWQSNNLGLQTATCDSILTREVPGSNLYASLWLCLGASLNIAFKWKQQQAQNFAQAQNDRAAAPRESIELGSGVVGGKGEDEDEEDDLDDFQDADVY